MQRRYRVWSFVFLLGSIAYTAPQSSHIPDVDSLQRVTTSGGFKVENAPTQRNSFLLRFGVSLMPTYATEDLAELVEKDNEFSSSLAADFHWGVAFFRRRISLCTAISGYLLSDDFSRREVDPGTYICYDWQEKVTTTESYSIRPIADLKILPSYSPGRFRFYNVFGLHVYSVHHERSTESVLVRRSDEAVMGRVEEAETSEDLHVKCFFGGGLGVNTILGEFGLELNGEEDALRGKVHWVYTFYP